MSVANPPRYFYKRKLPHFQTEDKLVYVSMNTKDRLFLPDGARDIVMEHILRENEQRIALHCVVVMPDHVHMLFTILETQGTYFPLASIMHGIRGPSSHRINKLLRRTGPVWQQEFFDRLLRYGEADKTVEYICSNPVNAGLVADEAQYRWLWISKWV